MCGIWLYLQKNPCDNKDYLFKIADSLKKRGPDMQRSLTYNFKNYTMYMNFYRLAINDLSENGMQPFSYICQNERSIKLMCNGEIYNFQYLIEKYKLSNVLKSNSDCEILIHIYKEYGIEHLYNELMMSDHVDAEFALIIVDLHFKTGKMYIHIARDMGGIRPLYKSYKTNESKDNSVNTLEQLCIGSQLCSIPNISVVKCDQFRPYSYGTYTFNIKKGKGKRETYIIKDYEYYQKDYNIRDFPITIFDEEFAKSEIKRVLTTAVIQRCHADREIMFMCSGGLDSSLCLGIGSQHLKTTKSMCIGLENSTDEKHAKEVANYVKSNHTHVLCTEQQFVDCALNDVVKEIESYDITSVRASTGQLLSARKIKEMNYGIVVIVGDYSDEITGGYNETKYAPTIEDFVERTYELVENIHRYDSQRVDRCIASSGLEARTPFGDHRFIKLYLSIDPKLRVHRNGIEKYLLRSAFADSKIIPDSVLWRPKEAFSDGVSSLKRSWYTIIQEHINIINEEKEEKKEEKKEEDYKHNKPISKESLYYRKQFCKYFSDNVSNVIPQMWLPKFIKTNEPSARTLDIYNFLEKSYVKKD